MEPNPGEIALEIIRTRRSVRRYLSTPVSRRVLDELLEVATWAPSAHNRQPWRFAVVETRETKESLATAMGERLVQDSVRDGTPREVIERDVARSFARISSAPVVVVACVTMRDMDVYPDARRSQAESTMAAQSVAMAVQNLLLSAHALGLGACWLCAPLFVPETVRRVLKLEADWDPQALITLGYPAEDKTKSRVPVSKVVRYLDSNQH